MPTTTPRYNTDESTDARKKQKRWADIKANATRRRASGTPAPQAVANAVAVETSPGVERARGEVAGIEERGAQLQQGQQTGTLALGPTSKTTAGQARGMGFKPDYTASLSPKAQANQSAQAAIGSRSGGVGASFFPGVTGLSPRAQAAVNSALGMSHPNMTQPADGSAPQLTPEADDRITDARIALDRTDPHLRAISDNPAVNGQLLREDDGSPVVNNRGAAENLDRFRELMRNRAQVGRQRNQRQNELDRQKREQGLPDSRQQRQISAHAALTQRREEAKARRERDAVMTSLRERARGGDDDALLAMVQMSAQSEALDQAGRQDRFEEQGLAQQARREHLAGYYSRAQRRAQEQQAQPAPQPDQKWVSDAMNALASLAPDDPRSDRLMSMIESASQPAAQQPRDLLPQGVQPWPFPRGVELDEIDDGQLDEVLAEFDGQQMETPDGLGIGTWDHSEGRFKKIQFFR